MSKNLQFKSLKRNNLGKDEYLVLSGPRTGDWVEEINPLCIAFEEETLKKVYNAFMFYHLQSNYSLINIGVILG